MRPTIEDTDSLDLVTFDDAEKQLQFPPSVGYDIVVDTVKSSKSITLSEAMGDGGDQVCDYLPHDILPTTPSQATSTGALPPASEGDLIHQKVNAKNVGDLEKVERLLSMGSLTLDDTKGYRIRMAYRLARQMSRVRGLLMGWERLHEALSFDHYSNGLTSWNVPIRLLPTGSVTGFKGVRSVLRHVDMLPERYTINTKNGYHAYKGSTVLPPPIPDQLYGKLSKEELWEARVHRTVPNGYRPSDDTPLCLYCEAHTLLAHQMGVLEGAPEEPWSGAYGIAGLLNPNTCRLAWPTMDELVLFEEELLLHIFDKTSEMSERRVQEYLRQYFGFTRFEAVDITKAAVEAGGVLYAETAETQRAMILKQIDAVRDKCSDACDPRAELAALKMKSQILGLTLATENESMSTLRDAATNALRPPDEDEDL